MRGTRIFGAIHAMTEARAAQLPWSLAPLAGRLRLIRELRALIQRFPNSPEAMQARSKLSGMGIPVTPKH